MRACVIHGVEDLRLEERPAEKLGERGVRVRVRAGGICGSDLHYYYEGRVGNFVIKEPLIPGHEFSGEVAEVGPAVQRVKPGDRVAVNPGRSCGHCEFCRRGEINLCANVFFMGSASKFPHMQGGFREAVAVEESQCTAVPGTVPFTTIAFAEPLSVALHAIRLAGPLVGKRVLVSGAGPIGLLIVMAARHVGAQSVTSVDIVAATLRAARQVGATNTINLREAPDALKDLAASHNGFDVVIEASGAPAALESAINVAKRGGTIVQVGTLPHGGVTAPLNLVMAKELTLKGAMRFGVEFDWAVELLTSGALDVSPLLTGEFPAERAAQAFALARDRTAGLKVMLTF